jgi:hypothetical protein
LNNSDPVGGCIPISAPIISSRVAPLTITVIIILFTMTVAVALFSVVPVLATLVRIARTVVFIGPSFSGIGFIIIPVAATVTVGIAGTPRKMDLPPLSTADGKNLSIVV